MHYFRFLLSCLVLSVFALSAEAQFRRNQDLPEGVQFRPDLSYREGNLKWRLDLYLPEGDAPEGDAPEGGRPGLVVVHGGGWRSGDKQGGVWSRIPAEYAAHGFVAISVNYRLRPEVGILDCIEDVKCAIRWFRANAEEFGLNPERIGGYGNSAGAHLVSMAGLTDASAGLEGDGPYQDQSSQLQAVCASATPTDFLNWKGEPRDPASIRIDFGGEGTTAEKAARVSPVTWVTESAPPFLLIHAENDRTVHWFQGITLRDKLKSAGCDVTFLGYPTGGHGVFGTKSEETGPAMLEFFQRELGK